MSQYLSFIFKNKDGVKFDGGYLSTTPARLLSYEGIFPYTDEEVILDNKQIEGYISKVREEIKKHEDLLKEYQEENEKLASLLVEAKSKEVYYLIKEDICSNNGCISEVEETIEEWKYYESYFSVLLNLLEENKEKFILYYTNC